MKTDCEMCNIRTTLKTVMAEVEAIPIIHSKLYDDEVSAAYLALEIAYDQFAHGCVEDDAALQPCSHPLSAIITNGTTSYCGSCADDSLRANIAAGVEL